MDSEKYTPILRVWPYYTILHLSQLLFNLEGLQGGLTRASSMKPLVLEKLDKYQSPNLYYPVIDALCLS